MNGLRTPLALVLAWSLGLAGPGCAPGRDGGGGDDDDDDDDDDADGDADWPDGGDPNERPCDFIGASYEGCEYWAVDLPNWSAPVEGAELLAADAQFAVVVSNGDATRDADVVVYSAEEGDETEVMREVVGPQSTRVLELGPANIEGTGTSRRAFRISSSRPVTAYQFNPLNNTEEAYSNDASLLLPINVLGDDYVVVTADGAVSGPDLDGNPINLGAFVAVVGVTDDPVTVTVTPSAEILAGDGIAAGEGPVEVTLEKYEVLALESRGSEDLTPGNGNLSGSRVVADHPVAVFAGTVCSFAPMGDAMSCCCDHTEEQMFPLVSLGRSFAAAPSANRASGRPQNDVWRLTAGAEPVTLEWVNRPSGAPEQLDALESVEFLADEPFAVSGDGRLSLAQILTSSQQVLDECTDSFDCGDGFDSICYGGRCMSTCDPAQQGADCPVMATCLADPLFPDMGTCEPIGDPAIILIPPLEQYRSDYVFLTPDDYEHDYVTVIAPDGTTLDIDGQDVSGWDTIGSVGGTDYVYSTVELDRDGTHIARASAPVALLVYGYDQDVSYAYPAGLDLEELFF